MKRGTKIALALGALATWLIPMPKPKVVTVTKYPKDEVPSERTPLDSAQAIQYLIAASESEGGNLEAGLMLAAQSHLETGGWRSVWNHNLGNIRGSYQGMTTSIPGATEIIDGKEVSVPSGFRAYPDFAAGATDLVSLIKRLYPDAWAAAQRGDIDGYNAGLLTGKGGRKYYTASPSKYLSVLMQRHAIVSREYEGRNPIT